MKTIKKGKLSRVVLCEVLYVALSILSLLLYYYCFDFSLLNDSLVIRILVVLTFLGPIFSELLVGLIILILFLNKRIVIRFTGYFLLFLVFSINGIQILALKRGHEYISSIALGNIKHVSLVLNFEYLLILIALLVVFALFLCIAELLGKESERRYKHIKCLIFLLVISNLMMAIPNKIYERQLRQLYINNNLLFVSPLVSFYNTVKAYFSDLICNGKDLSNEDIIEARKYGINIDINKKYPMLKERIYKEHTSFNQNGNESQNVFILFNEGISAKELGCYGCQYPDLTKNIDTVARDSMVVDNYYNHTAATYRGLLGQLCSIYPLKDGGDYRDKSYELVTKSHYYSLNKIFSQLGYETVFIDCHKKDAACVDEIMTNLLQFDNVYNAEDLAETYLNNELPDLAEALSDTQLFVCLVKYLRARLQQKDRQPLFLCMYNLGTHAWMDVAASEMKYGDGSNNVLNNIKNFDNAFGLFWDYYSQSPYVDNSVLFFTSDHCHYMESNYLKAFNHDGYQKFFVDKIPLIIYDKTRNIPRRFDAKNSTSLDLAPTIIHYMGLPNVKNSFLGTSIFEKEGSVTENYAVSCLGSSCYIINNNMVYSPNLSRLYNMNYRSVSNVVRYTQDLEVKDLFYNYAVDLQPLAFRQLNGSNNYE